MEGRQGDPNRGRVRTLVRNRFGKKWTKKTSLSPGMHCCPIYGAPAPGASSPCYSDMSMMSMTPSRQMRPQHIHSYTLVFSGSLFLKMPTALKKCGTGIILRSGPLSIEAHSGLLRQSDPLRIEVGGRDEMSADPSHDHFYLHVGAELGSPERSEYVGSRCGLPGDPVREPVLVVSSGGFRSKRCPVGGKNRSPDGFRRRVLDRRKSRGHLWTASAEIRYADRDWPFWGHFGALAKGGVLCV